MAFDSSKLCARTTAGEAELAMPSQGLSLGQRRVLTLLQNPVAVDELARQHRLEPENLARDLTHLADLRLVVLQGPLLASAPLPAPAPLRSTAKEAASMAPTADAPPPVQLAAAAPSSAAPRPAATAALKPISREPPDFPKEAIADGYPSGIVNARIHVDARGGVTGVDIMGSQPPKVFDRPAL
jgi:hypothetical protein